MLHRFAVLSMLSLIVALAVGAPPATASLRDYVARADASYDYEVAARGQVAGVRYYVVRMTSQTWRGRPWRHWLTLAVPERVEHAGKAALVVSGGTSQSGPPTEPGPVVSAARAAGVPVAMLWQVPNQPLFGGMYEDAAIAHSFEQYLRAENGHAGGEAGASDEAGEAEADGGDWPLLLPMVKSVVRAMDTCEAVLADEHDLRIDSYLLTGASKRGWTTWLAAAVDDRVQAIAPMVIDVLNFVPQMRRQQAVYGQASPMIRDYTERGLLAALGTDAGRSLMAMVDPFAYRDRLALPKLIVLGTNDPYWTVDAANLYLDEMEGPTCLAYVPNAGHQVSGRAAGTLLAFARRVFAGQALPRLRLARESASAGEAVTLRVSWDEPAARVTLWEATSPNRDFREATWRPRVLEAAGDESVSVTLKEPTGGWRAAFVAVRFAGEGDLTLSTPMTVVPERFPSRR